MFGARVRNLLRDARAAGRLLATGCRLLFTSVVSAAGVGRAGSAAAGERRIARSFGAIATRDLEALETMLAAGTDPNLRHPTGPSLLEVAVKNREVAIVESLLAHGADPNTTAPRQDSALSLAAFRNQKPSATLLVEAGADPTLPNPGPLGGTPLSLAVSGGYEQLCQTMLDHAEVDAGTLAELVAMVPSRGSDRLARMLRAAHTRASGKPAA